MTVTSPGFWRYSEMRLPCTASTAEALDVEMVSNPGGTFLMGPDRHYPEERPVHQVTVMAS